MSCGCYSDSKEYGLKYGPTCVRALPSPVMSIEGYKKTQKNDGSPRGWGCSCYSTQINYGSCYYNTVYKDYMGKNSKARGPIGVL